MKVAITGGNGHIGNAIIEELLRRKYNIKALVHSNNGFLANQPVEIVKGSLHDQNSLEQLLEGCDYLIHCAAIISINGDPDKRVQKTNVEGLENILEVASKSSLKRIIHVSSVHAYEQFPKNKPLTESSDFVQDTAYAYDKSKRDGQRLCQYYFQERGLPIIVINPTAVFGPPNYAGCKQNNAFISMSKGRIPFVFKGGYNWVDVRDIANSICNALTLGQAGESYILGGNYYTLKQLSGIISQASGKRIPCIEIPVGLVKFFLPLIGLYYKIRKQDPSLTRESIEILQFGNQHVLSSKAQTYLEHHARPIEQSMKDLLSWTPNKPL